MKKFKIEISENEIDYLKHRLANTRWPGEVIDEGWKKSVPTTYLKHLVDYWLNKFDWEMQQALLNQYPQFITEIDGQNIHFLHIKSPNPNAIL